MFILSKFILSNIGTLFPIMIYCLLNIFQQDVILSNPCSLES